MLKKTAKYKLIDAQPLNVPVFEGNLSYLKANKSLFDKSVLQETLNTIKVASKKFAEMETDGDSPDFDLEAEIKSHPDSLYVKCFAIKADETNDNGDHFQQEELRKATNTFVGVPVFTNHNNSDAEEARGKVVHSWWNEDRNGIMIIARVDAEAYPKLARGLKQEYIAGTSMGCWTGEMRVLVESGEYIPIKEIQVGDMVYTHLGNIKPVLNVQRHIDKENDFIYQIKAEGIPEILECTSEHPFWILKKQNVCSCGCGKQIKNATCIQSPLRKFQKRQKQGHYQKTNILLNDIKNDFEFEWKPSKELEVGDFVSFPIPERENSDEDATISKARLMGYFLAEGSFNKQNGVRKTVIFSLSCKEKDSLVKEIESLLKECFPDNAVYVQDKSNKGSIVIHCYGHNVAQWFYNYCNEYSYKKRLATKCLSWPKEVQKHIVGAWLAGDGYQRSIPNVPYQNFVGTTTSEVLRSQLVLLLSRFGIKSTTNITVDGKVSTLLKAAGLESVDVVNGSSTQTRRPAYAISISPTLSREIASFVSPYTKKDFPLPSMKNGNFRRTENYIVFPIKSITKRFNSEPVYNLEVENDHSYIVEGVAVKNCQVQYSVCSICHNKAANQSEYCSHVRERKTRKLSEKGIKCKYHENGGDEPCPICECKKGETKTFDVSDQEAFEFNFGIKFIENSFVVNPACHDCGVTEIIDPQEFLKKVAAIQTVFPRLLKAAASQNIMCCDTGCVKFAGQNEIDNLNQALDLVTVVSQSMLQQKDQLDLEFVSDLVQVLSDLQTVTDELTQQGYARLPSPADTEGQPGGQPGGQPSMGGQDAALQPLNPTPGGGSKIQSGSAGEAGSVTAPTASSRFDMTKIALALQKEQGKTFKIKKIFQNRSKKQLNFSQQLPGHKKVCTRRKDF